MDCNKTVYQHPVFTLTLPLPLAQRTPSLWFRSLPTGTDYPSILVLGKLGKLPQLLAHEPYFSLYHSSYKKMYPREHGPHRGPRKAAAPGLSDPWRMTGKTLMHAWLVLSGLILLPRTHLEPGDFPKKLFGQSYLRQALESQIILDAPVWVSICICMYVCVCRYVCVHVCECVLVS